MFNKKYIITFFALTLISFQSLFAQQDEKAKKVLDEMSNYYQSLSSFSADINQKAISIDNNEVMGTLAIKIKVSGDKYQLQTLGQVIYNDTKNTYRFDKEMEEVTIEAPSTDENNILSQPSKIYSIYKKNFKYLYTGKENGLDVVDLSPNQGVEIDFFRIRMFINPSTHELVKWEMYEKGNKTKYVLVINNFKKNVPVTDKDFVFDTAANPNVEVVDLR